MGSDLFSIGRTALATSKKSIATTSHNIANANNENFSRQRITTESGTPVGEGDVVMGTGVRIREIKRVHNDMVEKKFNDSISDKAFHEERTYQLERLEEVFNEINSDGLNKVMSRFFNSFKELANQPENEVIRTLVRDNAKLVVEDFKRMDQSLTTIKEAIDNKMGVAVQEINLAADKVATLNREIIRLENLGGETGDLRDQRDEQIRIISEFMDVETYQDQSGQYMVNIRNVGSLVAGGHVNTLKAGKVKADPESQRADEGKTEIYFEANRNLVITDNFKRGSLRGLVKTRSEEIETLRKQMDELAYNLAKATNAIHRRGYANKAIPVDEQGRTLASAELVTGIDFFKEPTTVNSAANTLALSDEVTGDLNNISTGLTPNAPGDNRVALAISKLQHEKVVGPAENTFEELYLEAVGSLGLTTAKSKIDLEQSEGIHTQAKSIKQRISGVSLDEETANLVKYQHTYDASARVIRTADEMFDSVLGMMR